MSDSLFLILNHYQEVEDQEIFGWAGSDYFGDSPQNICIMDPDNIEDPNEFDKWTQSLVKFQSFLQTAIRHPKGQKDLQGWMSLAPRVEGDDGNAAGGTPREIQRLFPRLVQRSVEGELFVATAPMVDEAKLRASEAEYAELTLKHLPAREGFVVIPEGAWCSEGLTNEAEKQTPEGYVPGSSWHSGVSWTATDSFVELMFWATERTNHHLVEVPDDPEFTEGYRLTPAEEQDGADLFITIAHSWGMKFDGSIEHGKLAKPIGDKLLEMSFHFIATGCELVKMLQEEIETTRPVVPYLPKPDKRRVKKQFGRVPSVRTYDLRRRVYDSPNESNREGQGCGRELETSHRRRGHYRRVNKGTPQEYVVWVKSSVVRPDLKPKEQTDRIGLLRR